MFILWILSLFLISGNCQNYRPTVTLFNSDIADDDATYIYKFHGEVPKLDYLPFENGHKRCFTGVWLLYQQENFAGFSIPYFRPDEDCFISPPAEFPFRSFRPIGSPSNYSTPALSLFNLFNFVNFNYTDPPTLRLEDDPNLGGLFGYASFILNGPEAITLYSGINYGGMKLCVLPEQINGFATGVYDVEYELGISRDMIKSFRFGCHSDIKTRIGRLSK